MARLKSGLVIRAIVRLAWAQTALVSCTYSRASRRAFPPPQPPASTSAPMSAPTSPIPMFPVLTNDPPRAGRVSKVTAGTLPPVSRTATCVWRVEPTLVVALDAQLGSPGRQLRERHPDLAERRRARRDDARVAVAPGRGVPPARGHVALRPLGAGGRGARRRASMPTRWSSAPSTGPCGRSGTAWSASPRTARRSSPPRSRRPPPRRWNVRPTPRASSTTTTSARSWEQANGTVSIVEMLLAELRHPRRTGMTG